MKKELKDIITVDGKKVCRITTPDERWYGRETIDPKTGLPDSIIWVPSATWLASYYPKGIGYMKWLASHGYDEAEAIKKEAGQQGDKVHQATEDIDKGEAIKIDAKYLNKERGEMEELNFEELLAIQSYQEWVDKTEPELVANEMTVFGTEGIKGILPNGWGGTLDRIFRIKGQLWVVDLKTSNNIWPSHELQLSAYGHADINLEKLKINQEEWENRKLAILQLGYPRNQHKYKFTEVQDKYDLFIAACKIWLNENPSAAPKQRDFPLVIQSAFRQEQLKVKETKKQNNAKK